MKIELTKKIVAIALVGLFSHFSLAQDNPVTAIAGIVANMNHFPSDADKAALTAISDGAGERRGIQMLANAVSNIQHGATDEGKAAMGQIIAFDGAPDNVKALAQIILDFNHTASAEAKATLAGL